MTETTTTFAPVVGEPYVLMDDLSVVLAPNPSPMTYLGTNTFLLGRDQLAIIDPGPDDPNHLDALLRAVQGRKVTHILVTHAHLDHSPLAAALGQAVDAPVLAFGDSKAGQSAVMRDLAASGLAGGGEGVDRNFAPDVVVSDGEVIANDEWSLTALHTPGHMGNHLCFQWGDVVFTGDLVMGWSSSLVSPPDGDLTDFMASCAKLGDIPARRYFPAHGAPIDDPASRLDWLVGHRQTREAQILAALRGASLTIGALTRAVYADLAPGLLVAAERNVFAHLVDLTQRGVVRALPGLSLDAKFALIDSAT